MFRVLLEHFELIFSVVLFVISIISGNVQLVKFLVYCLAAPPPNLTYLDPPLGALKN